MAAKLLSANAQWAADVERLEPGFFTESAKGQSPHTLWIGCADSRVPESVITGAKPGDIFVNRNVGNQVNLKDDNMLAVLTYAVDFVGVEHVVVVGHTECGAAAACFGASQAFNENTSVVTIPSLPADHSLNCWLAPLTGLAVALQISSAPAEDALKLLVEENVRMQVDNLCQSEPIANAFKNGKSAKGKAVEVHGWVYDIAHGKLKDLGISRKPQGSK